MTETWDGYPEYPEQDGWHWLLFAEGEPPIALLWQKQMWNVGYIGMPVQVFSGVRYLGPCLTPAEVGVLVDKAVDEAVHNAMLEASTHDA